MDYGEINKYLKQAIDKKIKQSTSPDKEMFKDLNNKIENHTIHEYKFLHYLDNIPIDEDMCDMEDNFLISCYYEYMYQYRNNTLRPSRTISSNISKNIKKSIYSFIPIPFNKKVTVAGFGNKS